MPIPPFDPDTGYLPPGDHRATWDEIKEVFGGSFRRRELLHELGHVIDDPLRKGVRHIWIDGSFATQKARPNDVDVLYEAPPDTDVTTWGRLAPERRKELKKEARVDLWKAPAPQPVPGQPFKQQSLHDLWATDRNDTEKGTILLEVTDDDQE